MEQQSKGGCPKYRLSYFNARGYAEVSRLTFAVAGIPFEDVRFKDREEWEKVKPYYEAGFVPCLEVDGVQISQSRAILRYLGREFKLDGGSGVAFAHVNTIIEDVRDFIQELIKMHYEQDEERKAKIAEDIDTNKRPKLVERMEKFLEKNGTGYLVGPKLTIADIAVFELFDSMAKRPAYADIIANSEPLKKHAELVKSNVGIAQWLKDRPDTEN